MDGIMKPSQSVILDWSENTGRVRSLGSGWVFSDITGKFMVPDHGRHMGKVTRFPACPRCKNGTRALRRY
jgi:hypothetical protein